MSWKFCCELRVDNCSVYAEEVFHSGWTNWQWSDGTENTLVGEITRLRVQYGDVRDQKMVRARFLATPSALLRSADIISSREGKIVVDKVAREGPRCRASAEIDFQFSTAYSEGAHGEVESNLQAVVTNPSVASDFSAILSFFQDVLVLASFAERRHIICTGWELEYEDGAREYNFRRDFTRPLEEEKVDIDETLISLPEIEAFLNDGMSRLGDLTDKGAVQQAIYFALSGKERGIEDVYMVLFAGIETLLNRFRSEENLERVIEKPEWKKVQARIESLLRSDEAFTALGAEAQLAIQQRIPELNRVSFPTAFRRMCSAYRLEVADLWPMVDRGTISLYSLRNRIVHGRVFPKDSDWFRLVSAKHHLLWTLERTILKILGWPVTKSRVSPRFLSHMTMYHSWKEDQQYFASL